MSGGAVIVPGAPAGARAGLSTAFSGNAGPGTGLNEGRGTGWRRGNDGSLEGPKDEGQDKYSRPFAGGREDPDTDYTSMQHRAQPIGRVEGPDTQDFRGSTGAWARGVKLPAPTGGLVSSGAKGQDVTSSDAFGAAVPLPPVADGDGVLDLNSLSTAALQFELEKRKM